MKSHITHFIVIELQGANGTRTGIHFPNLLKVLHLKALKDLTRCYRYKRPEALRSIATARAKMTGVSITSMRRLSVEIFKKSNLFFGESGLTAIFASAFTGKQQHCSDFVRD